MRLDTKQAQSPQTKPANRPYSTPRLESLGGIAQLTAGPVNNMSADGASGMGTASI